MADLYFMIPRSLEKIIPGTGVKMKRRHVAAGRNGAASPN
jgi:hypothetical protein